MPNAIFIEELPRIEVTEGLVHIQWADEQHSYWRPSMFRAFVEDGRRKLDLFDRMACGVVPFRARE